MTYNPFSHCNYSHSKLRIRPSNLFSSTNNFSRFDSFHPDPKSIIMKTLNSLVHGVFFYHLVRIQFSQFRSKYGSCIFLLTCLIVKSIVTGTIVCGFKTGLKVLSYPRKH